MGRWLRGTQWQKSQVWLWNNMPSRPISGTLLWVILGTLALVNAASLPLEEKVFSESSDDHINDNFVVCTSSADCYPISPSILINILGGLGENLPNSALENDVNIEVPQRRGISGSYLFRSKKDDGGKEKKSNRRGGYLFRTKKMGRYTRGDYLFRTRKFDQPPNRSYLFRTR